MASSNSIDHASREPLWEQLAGVLRGQIESGDFTTGELFPGERELSASSGVARTTVRRALLALADAGLIVNLPRRGWRVQ